MWRPSVSNVLEVICLEVFHENLFLRLNLQKFEEQAEKLCWTLVPIDSSDAFELDSLVDETLRGQCKTMLLPVIGLIYTISNDCFDEKLRRSAANIP